MSVPTPSAGRVGADRADSKDEPALFEIVFPRGVANLDGTGNNRGHPGWGTAYGAYARIGARDTRTGCDDRVAGPRPRYVSNRVFNDVGQNLFSENGVTQWGFAWGQFLDHTFGLRATGTKGGPITFDPRTRSSGS